MSDYGELLLSRKRKRGKVSSLRPAVLFLAPLGAILFQVYVPLLFQHLAYLELPLLITVYFALVRRRPISGLLYGAAIGLVQDSLSHHPIGMFGMVKTLVGYFSASVSMRFDVDNPVARFILAYFFFFFHEFFYWVLSRTLLGSLLDFSLRQTLLLGIMNAVVAVPLFRLLDKLKGKG